VVRVLLVEDDRRLAESLRRSVVESRMAVDVSHDGEEALAAVSASSYDVIVKQDMALPRKRCYAANIGNSRWIRSQESANREMVVQHFLGKEELIPRANRTPLA